MREGIKCKWFQEMFKLSHESLTHNELQKKLGIFIFYSQTS